MKSKNNAFSFERFSHSQIDNYTSIREGEIRIGEKIQTEIGDSTEFVILGIMEDVGPQANLGNPGSKNAFVAFLTKFLNMQSNRFLKGKEITVLGAIHQERDVNNLTEKRNVVAELDDFVIQVINKSNIQNQKLIVIGGGHNNAYPIIRYFSEKNQPLHIVNIDPHADCRPLEGRHSGNPFSTAISEDQVLSYRVFGLHEQYNNEAIYNFLNEHNCSHTFFEDYLDGRSTLKNDLSELPFKENIGLEIDLDSIENMPTSAYTPSGFTLDEIRSAIRSVNNCVIQYLHLPEGAPKNDIEKTIVGKALAYLVADFIKTQKKSNF